MIRALLIALCLPAAAAAQIPSELARADLNLGWREDGVHVAGLRIRMLPGWKTYWRAPGDSGIPPTFNWSGSDNLKAVRIQYPVPEVFYTDGMRSYGYHDEVVFPLWIEPQDASKPVTLKGEVEIGVCDDVCVPVTLRIGGALPPGGQRGPDLSAAIQDRPERARGLRCDILPIKDGLQLSVELDSPRLGTEDVAVVETSDPTIWVSTPEVSRSGGRLRAVVDMVPPQAKPFALARSDVRLTILGGGRAVEALGCD